jgi:hypothetical protein
MSKCAPMVADKEWYEQQNVRRALPAHCPLAANDKCPRYYVSLKHATMARVASCELASEAFARVEKNWEVADVFTSMDETAGTWFDKEGALSGISGYCPEVSARIFGLYCSSLKSFPDEEARRSVHKTLRREGAPDADPRWRWMIFEPMHYTSCHEYSVYVPALLSKKSNIRSRKGTLSPKLRFQVFDRDGFRCIYCGATAGDGPLHVDHKVPVAVGGTNEIENLATACERCNLGKGADRTSST